MKKLNLSKSRMHFKCDIRHAIFLILSLLLPLSSFSSFAFRDINPNSKLYEPLQHFIEKCNLNNNGFFRPDEPIPQIMFWHIVICDTDFDNPDNNFDTRLPENVDENHEAAPYIKEAVRRGFINLDEPFDPLVSIRRGPAIFHIVESKGIPVSEQVSSKFREIACGISRLAKYFPHVEAAYASKMLIDSDICDFAPRDYLTRRDLITWLNRWKENGQPKESGLNLPFKNKIQYPYQKRQKNAQQIKVKTQKIEEENNQKPQTIKIEDNLDIIVMMNIYQRILENYPFIEKLTEEEKRELIHAATEGMVKALGDKYSNYVKPEKQEEFLEGLEGEFEGIGAYVEMIDEKFCITSPIKGSPAEKAGIRAGDCVTHVDDQDISELGIREIINMVRGPAGTKVKLTILRNGNTINITVTRGKITIPAKTLKWKNGIAIVGLHQFSRNSCAEVKTMLTEEIIPEKPRGIIFDLRNNPGGYLTAATCIGEIFLKNGEKIFCVKYKDSEKCYRAKGKGLLSNNKNIIFLQNKGSASASEIITSMAKAYGIGKIIGTNSVGKGTVQEIVNFANDSSLKLTVAKWLGPKGNWINEIGVEPDIIIEDPTEEQRKNEIDPQLDAALQEVTR